MLENLTGLGSWGDRKMTQQKLSAGLTHMRALSFDPTPGKAVKLKAPPATQKQLGLVRGLWQRMYAFGIVRDASDRALNAYCLRMTGRMLGSCSVAQCQRLTECLKNWWQRAANPEHIAILESMLASRDSGHVVQ